MNAFERDISCSAFHIGNVRAMEARPPGEFFLRNPKMISPEPNGGPKILFYVYHRFGFSD